jgi:hypothetical protein
MATSFPRSGPWATEITNGVGQEKPAVRNETRRAFEKSPRRTPGKAAIGQGDLVMCSPTAGPHGRAGQGPERSPSGRGWTLTSQHQNQTEITSQHSHHPLRKRLNVEC